MDILSSGELANLTNREADVAIRVVYDRKTLPLNLHGLKGPALFGGVYISRDRLAAWRAGAPDPIRWIVISIFGIPDWAREGEFRTTGVPFRATDAEAQIVAVRQGLGITTLPCFVGDADPLLVRVPGPTCTCTEPFGFSHRGKHARRSASGSSRSLCPARSPRTLRFLEGCQYRATDARGRRRRLPSTSACKRTSQRTTWDFRSHGAPFAASQRLRRGKSREAFVAGPRFEPTNDLRRVRQLRDVSAQ